MTKPAARSPRRPAAIHRPARGHLAALRRARARRLAPAALLAAGLALSAGAAANVIGAPPAGPSTARAATGEPGLRSGAAWQVVASVRGTPAAWIGRRGGVTLLRFDQGVVRLALHAGSTDPGPGAWPHGDAVLGAERRRLVAGFNGGFRLNSKSGGWQAGGRTAVPLVRGLGSIVTYRDGTTDIGAWLADVPSGLPVESVRQNLHLLVNGGAAAPNVVGCILACWGATVGGRLSVARSGLGVSASGMLIWAGASSATPASLAHALIAAGAVRAAELDINPDWVAGYLYGHAGGGTTVTPVVPGQRGVPGQFLTPYSRDFFTVVDR